MLQLRGILVYPHGDKLRAYTILDNSSMDERDWQALQLEWDTAQLDDWGIDLPDFTDEQDEDAIAEEDEDAIAEEDDYEMPEEIEEVETDIQQGDLIILEGRGLTHRLMELDPDIKVKKKQLPYMETLYTFAV
ncbi:hypothetical protein [Porphyromonas sp.]|uniref:hypothetical protein n=1 Tax=Porphyromonas sp. TaxID=1924944 RepID=UPI003991EC83